MILLLTAVTGAWGVDQERAKRVLMLFGERKHRPANIFLERATRAELEKHTRCTSSLCAIFCLHQS
jgi:hypothetical protein